MSQDNILGLKSGFFSPSEGSDNDMGVCVKNGTYYFGVKAHNEWQYIELNRDVATKGIDVINQSFSTLLQNKFEFLLNQFSSTINHIVNERAPRVFVIPFSGITYTVGATTVYPSSILVPSGLGTVNLIDDVLRGDADGGGVANSYMPVDFKCRLKTIRVVGAFSPTSGNDTDDARFGISTVKYDQTLTTSSSPTIGQTAPNYVASNDSLASWIINPPISDFTLKANEQISIVTSLTNPTTNKWNSFVGNLFFEEIL